MNMDVAPDRTDCLHRAPDATELRRCKSCLGNVRVKVFPCAIHGTCTTGKRIPRTHFCGSCNQFVEAGRVP